MCEASDMKEDVLEQIVDDYLQIQGYLTTPNVRFNPPRGPGYVAQDGSVPSDVVGLHPRRTGTDRVMVVSCKSWQTGLDATRVLAQLRDEAPNPKRPRGTAVPGTLVAEVVTSVPAEDRGINRRDNVHLLPSGSPRALMQVTPTALPYDRSDQLCEGLPEEAQRRDADADNEIMIGGLDSETWKV
jgi:hypothetical protein